VLQFGYVPGTTNLTLFASFYTYDNMGNQAWLVALPGSINGTTVNVDVYITNGRMWGDDFDPADGATSLWGSGTFTFPTCTSGSVSLVPNASAQALGYSNLSYHDPRDFISTAPRLQQYAVRLGGIDQSHKKSIKWNECDFSRSAAGIVCE
jgi:hypothetical protein